jgi:TRAP-type mannitol/chloroaromatic compound transport system permease large subunit
MKGVAPRSIPMQEVYAAAMPYVGFGLAVLVLILLFPGIATWLPGLFSR